MKSGALSGLRIVEYAAGLEGSYCGKLLASLGAEVIKVEPPEGDRERRMPPYAGEIPHVEKSISFLYANQGKKSVTLDVKTAKGRAMLLDLVHQADGFITYPDSSDPDWPTFAWEELSAGNGGLIWLDLTPLGDTGPYKDYKCYPLTLSHMSGLTITYPLGSEDLTRPPVMLGGRFEEYDLGVMAAGGLLAALCYRKKTGEGQRVSLSSLAARIALSATENTIYPQYGVVVDRRGINRRQTGAPIYRCKDGYLCPFFSQPAEYQRLAEMLGKTEWLAPDHWYQQKLSRIAHIEEVIAAISTWAQDKTKAEITELARAYKVPITAVVTPGETVAMEQFQVRELFTEVEQPGCGRLRTVGRPFVMAQTPCDQVSPAPGLGEHNKVFLGTEGGDPI